MRCGRNNTAGRNRVIFQRGKGRSQKNGEVAIPQRHRIAGFAAVVEGGRRCNTHHRAYHRGNGSLPSEKACICALSTMLPYRNGTESRDLLPLWKEEEDAIRTTEPITRVLGNTCSTTAGKHGKCCRCGIRISAKTLWKDTLPPACQILPDNLSASARRAVRSPGFSPAG